MTPELSRVNIFYSDYCFMNVPVHFIKEEFDINISLLILKCS